MKRALLYLLLITTTGLGPKVFAIALPDSVSQAELGLNAVKEFSQDGPIPNRHCASLREEFFAKDKHGDEYKWDQKPPKENPYRNAYLRMRNFAIGRFDCKAFVENDAADCETADCRAILKQDVTLCEGPDCKALLSKKSSLCETGICRAFVTHNASACSGDCAAYLRNEASFCETNDCRAHLERRSLHCDTNTCFALIQQETFFCFKED